MATNDSYLRPAAGDGVNDVRLRNDAPDGGAATITGTLASTEVSDSAAIVGLIAHTGTLAATESSDTTAILGLVNHTGSLSATEVSDSAAIVGLVNHTGSMAVTEASDTFASSGTVTGSTATITGDLVALEGSDTAIFAGFVDHTGTLASTEASDTSSIAGLVNHTEAKNGGDDAPRTVKNLKYKPKPRKDDFGNEIVIPEAISALTVEKYTLKPTRVSANELQSHLEIDDEEAILMLI
jgi:hypothetical protein